jgi:two-component system LytT family response regulator
MILKSIIIDDDEFIRKMLRDKIEKNFPELLLVADCSNAADGLQAIGKHDPDIVFLDIEMPGMSGFEMLNTMPVIGFEIIFITAFDHYAIKAIRYSALDYLLKPVDTNDLKAALERLQEKRKRAATNQKESVQNFINNLKTKNPEEYKLAISTAQGTLFLPATEIIRLEAEGSYTTFHLKNRKRLIASRTLKDFADLLDKHRFIRIHKSHVINSRYVKYMLSNHQLLMEDDSKVDVSRRKWEEVKNLLKKSA